MCSILPTFNPRWSLSILRLVPISSRFDHGLILVSSCSHLGIILKANAPFLLIPRWSRDWHQIYVKLTPAWSTTHWHQQDAHTITTFLKGGGCVPPPSTCTLYIRNVWGSHLERTVQFVYFSGGCSPPRVHFHGQSQNDPNTTTKWPQHNPKKIQKWYPKCSKAIPKLSQHDSRIIPK